MIMQLIDKKRLFMALDRSDMKRIGIIANTSFCDYTTLKKQLNIFLLKAYRETGFECNNKKLLIQIIPGHTNGCVILFTLLRVTLNSKGKIYRIKRPDIPIIYEFSDLESLMNAIKILFVNTDSAEKSSLIYYSDKYYFIVYKKRKGKDPLILNEYSTFYGTGSVLCAKLKEHGSIILDDNVIYEIGKYL